MKIIISLAFLLLLSFSSFGQIQGIVFGLTEGKRAALKNASIQLSKAQIRVLTNEEGRFELVLPKQLPDTLVVTAKGFLPDSIVVTKEDRYTGLEIYLIAEETLEEVVVAFRRDSKTISRLNPLQVENLSEGEFKKAACCNLSESFETNATVDVNITDAVSGAKKIQLLGLDGTYTQLQMENIPFLTGLEGSFGLNTVPGTWVESIQITKGTGSVVNGYESMAGLINVEFRKPQTVQRLFVNGYGSSIGRGELNIHGGQILGNRWSTSSFAHISGMQHDLDRNKDGFRDMPLNKTASAMNRWEYNGKNFESRFGVNAYYDERLGGQLERIENRYAAQTINKHVDFFAKTGFLFPKKTDHSIGIVYQFKVHDLAGNFGPRNYGGNELRGYINAIYDGILGSPAHKIKTGISAIGQRLDQYVDSTTINRELITPGVFAEYTYTAPRFTAVLGARYDIQEGFGNQFSPRIHLKYVLDEYTDLRVTSGKAWRLPNAIVDNSSLLATSKVWVLPAKIEQEVIWNSGVSVVRQFRLWKRSASISADFYHARFQRQLIVDREQSVDTFFFAFQSGIAFTNTFQTELSFSPWKTLTIRLAYKYLEVKANYNGKLEQQVMIPRHRGLLNLAYASRNQKWEWDATLSVYGKTRLQDVVLPNGEMLENEKSKIVPIVLSQITYHFKRFDVYLGGENLANFTQKNPIISSEDPFGSRFDATRVWAPIMGTTIYGGFRYEIKRPKTDK